MKVLYSIAFCLIFLSAWTQPHTYTRLSEMELKGKVKSFSYEIFFVHKTKEGKIPNIVRGGDKLRKCFYNPEGYLYTEETYAISGIPEDTALLLTSRYFYEKGRVVKIINYGTNIELENTYYILDSVDFIYKNDSMYSRVSETIIDDSIRLVSNYNYTITKNQHIIDQAGGQGHLFYSIKISFDNSGRKIKYVREQPEHLKGTSTYFYLDDSAKKPEYIEFFNGDAGKKNKTQYLYNNQNDIIAELKFDESNMKNETFYYEYDYDPHGNWLEKRSLDESGQLMSLVRRSITYWEE